MAEECTQHPNVLCFVTDQQRHDHLGCAGNSILQTPNIDRLARSGMRFERCYVNNPFCMPSRSTMWTGQTPSAHRVRCNGIPLDPVIPTIVSALGEAGYRTHGVGKFHLSPFHSLNGAEVAALDPAAWAESKQMWRGGRISALPTPYYGLQSAILVGGHGDFIWGEYRRWLLHEAPWVIRHIEEWVAQVGGEDWETMGPSHIPVELHHSGWIADRTIEFLEEQRATGRPFFCWCSFPDPHHPYHAPEPYHSMYDPGDMPLPARREGELDDLPPHFQRIQHEAMRVGGLTAPVTRFYDHTPEIMARTYGMVSQVDFHVGRVIKALEELGFRDNTLVIYLSDHGDLMGDHWLQQKGPFHFDGLIRVPFIWSWPGHISGDAVDGSVVSMLDFAPTILDLCSVPIPEGLRPAEPLIPVEIDAWPGRSLRPSLVGGEVAGRDGVLVENDADYLGLRLRTLVTERYRLTWYAGQPYGELFDLQEDPQELYNRWDDAGYRRVRDELVAHLLDQVVMSDPRLPRRLSKA